MNSEPLISVIMPSYNSALTIRRAVLSVARQTYKNTEIIVVDNSSADNTAEAVKEMQAELGGRLKLIVQPNTGVSSARNTGIREAKGEYFVSLDSDDYYEPETIRTLYEALTGDASDVAICGMRKVYEDGETPNEELAPEGRFKGTLKEFLGSSFTALYDLHLIQTHSNKLYKAEVIRNGSIYYNEELAVNEDIDFVMRYLAACERVSVVQDIFLNYVQHKKGQSLINTFQPHGLKGALIVLGSWMKLSEKAGASEETKSAMD
ncbi:MAG: glycosyltransferase family 2 protein, partial [Eubacteriales bacterium]|nr:glycosyltransferase family 2 protein [Eubacteriales bacterium]